MVVRHHVGERDVVLVHERGGELGGAVNRLRLVVALVFAHLDPDGVAVSGAVEIGVLASLVGRDVLDDDIVLHRKVPAEIAAGAATQRAPLQCLGVSVGVTGVVLGAVDGDEARLHRSIQSPAVGTLANQVAPHLDDLVESLGRNR